MWMFLISFISNVPFVICQLLTQPVIFYQTPLSTVSADSQYVYGQIPDYQLGYQPGLTQPSYVLQTPYEQYEQPAYQPLQYPTYQNGLSPNLNLYQNTLAREVHGGYLNEFRDEMGSLAHDDPSLNHQPTTVVEHASYMSLINDKDNFQASGCGWDVNLLKCTDALGLCKGGCRDFAVSASATLHDCRCIPYGYAALLKLLGK